MYEDSMPNRRYALTLSFLKKVLPPTTVLDLGIENPFSQIMKANGYTVMNTSGEDLDTERISVHTEEVDAIVAFEILEHLLNPFSLLQEIRANKLVVTVPLKLWFAPAYRHKTDERDRHYHEFEDWQFDWLLEKTGWKIMTKEKWTSPTGQFGIRPLLRRFTPRYYAVYAERIPNFKAPAL